jgi:plasmid stabilization system protein ParE
MTFRVHMLPTAKRQLYESANWWAEHRSTEQAVNWLTGFETALESLTKNAADYSPAPEDHAFPTATIRQMDYGLKGKKTHRAVFEVPGNDVLIHAIRHLAQRELTPDDFDT